MTDSRLVNLLLRLFTIGPKNQRLVGLLATDVVVVGATLTMVALANQIEN